MGPPAGDDGWRGERGEGGDVKNKEKDMGEAELCEVFKVRIGNCNVRVHFSHAKNEMCQGGRRQANRFRRPKLSFPLA